jgi:TrmH family RNA methyltransferase
MLSPGCVDPYNPKTVRASAGGIFDIDIYEDIHFEKLSAHFKDINYKFVAAVASSGIPLNEWKREPKNIIFFGQEASGLSTEIVDQADVCVSIESFGKQESLNLSVAAGIFMYACLKKVH